MSDGKSENESRIPDDRIVYVVPTEVALGRASDGFDVPQILAALRQSKLAIVTWTLACTVGATVYAFASDKWYRAEVVLAPSEQKSSISSIDSTLSGLAALAGVTVGGGDETHAVALLQSRELARAFIEDLELLPILFADDWDVSNAGWRDSDPAEWPDVWDGVKYFHDTILRVEQDRETSLVTVAVYWTDPELAASWANQLVSRVNESIRQRALADAEQNLAYLQSQLSTVRVVSLQQSISRLLDAELQRVMLARGNDEFAFKVIDPAVIPSEQVRPNRPLVMMIGAMFGVILSIIVALVTRARFQE